METHGGSQRHHRGGVRLQQHESSYAHEPFVSAVVPGQDAATKRDDRKRACMRLLLLNRFCAQAQKSAFGVDLTCDGKVINTDDLLWSGGGELQQTEQLRLDQRLYQRHHLVDEGRRVHDVDLLQPHRMRVLDVAHEDAQRPELDAGQMTQPDALHVEDDDVTLHDAVHTDLRVVEHAERLHRLGKVHLGRVCVGQTVVQQPIALWRRPWKGYHSNISNASP
uniref:Uncharacterized protein n=1 Tax=Anopheles farauti TaxID=69004 RepID=A0A182QIM1_9DIPT